MNEKMDLTDLEMKILERFELVHKRIDQLEERMSKREHDLCDIYGRISRLEMEVENDD